MDTLIFSPSFKASDGEISGGDDPLKATVQYVPRGHRLPLVDLRKHWREFGNIFVHQPGNARTSKGLEELDKVGSERISGLLCSPCWSVTLTHKKTVKWKKGPAETSLCFSRWRLAVGKLCKASIRWSKRECMYCCFLTWLYSAFWHLVRDVRLCHLTVFDANKLFRI